MFGGVAPALSPAEAAALTQKFKTQLVGTWKANLGDGSVAEIAYLANGTFTDTLTTGGTPKTISGTWATGNLAAGNKGIRITRTVNGAKSQVTAVFEDDELLHATQESGLTGAFRK
jgi:hypothetical protein